MLLIRPVSSEQPPQARQRCRQLHHPHHGPQGSLVGSDHGLLETAAPRRRWRAGWGSSRPARPAPRSRPVDAGKRGGGVVRTDGTDGIGVRRAKAFHRDHLDPISAFKILPGAVEDGLGIGRHEGNTSGAQRPDGVPDGLGRGEGRNPGAGGHLAGGGGIVLVRGQAGGRLNQTHDFHLRRAEQRGLVRNIVRPAGGEGGVVALAEESREMLGIIAKLR